MDTYYHPKDLPRFSEVGKDSAELRQKFNECAVFKEGALSEREKALIALAVAHAVRGPYCIEACSTVSLEKGSTPEQMTEAEAVHVAAAIRGLSSCIREKAGKSTSTTGCAIRDRGISMML